MKFFAAHSASIRALSLPWRCLTAHALKCAAAFIMLSTGFSALAQIKPTPAADRMKAVQQRRLLEQRSMVNGIRFTGIGPSIMSGRVVDIDVNPQDPTEFYVAYATGGLWYTNNNGQSFSSVFDSEDVITIGDIAVNWGKNGKDRVIWVGTGEVNSSRSSYAGTGVYKSIDNGKTWQYMGLPESHHIGKIQLHPSNPNIAWVAVLGHLYSPGRERGIYKTTDGGKSWKQTLFIDDNTGVVDIDINPSQPSELYAAAWYRSRHAWNFEESGKTSGIYKSNDGGDSWQLITKPGAGFPTGEGVGRIGISVYTGHPQTLYAVVDNNFHRPDTAAKKKDSTRYVLHDFEKISREEFAALDTGKLEKFLRQTNIPARYNAQMVKDMVHRGELKPTVLFDYLFDANAALIDVPIIGCEVYRSDDGGSSWKKMNREALTLYNSYGYYFGKIIVSPVNDQKLVITGFNIELSEDGGKTFKKIDKPNVHPDHHICWIDPAKDSHFIIGNDGGCNITYDNGATWFKANMPAVGQFYSVVTDNAKPYHVYGGLQDNGVWWGPSTNSESTGWQASGDYPFKGIIGGDGMQVQVDTRDNNTVYSGYQFGFYLRSKRISDAGSGDMAPEEELETSESNFAAGKEEGVAKTETDPDEGRPLGIHPQPDLGQEAYRFNWQTPIFLSQHNQDVFYYGSNHFHRSLHRGAQMETLSGDLSNGKRAGDVPFGTITTIAESPLKFGLLYAGTDDGQLQISKDGGYSWTLISKKLPPGLWVSRVIASRYKEGRVYVTLNGYRNDHFLPYLYVSDDEGANWKTLARDLPFEPLNVIREDPRSDSILYVGSDGGLLVSIDAGNSFMLWNNGLPRSVPVHDIAIQDRDNEIVLGTHGRSLYKAKLDSVQLLLKNAAYREKKQSAADKMVAVAQGTAALLFSREGIEVDCPPVNGGKHQKGGKAKKNRVAITLQ